MQHEPVAEQMVEPDPQQPSAVIMEIRIRMSKLDGVDEIVRAVNSMCTSMRHVVRE
jgi:hypothetical protein